MKNKLQTLLKHKLQWLLLLAALLGVSQGVWANGSAGGPKAVRLNVNGTNKWYNVYSTSWDYTPTCSNYTTIKSATTFSGAKLGTVTTLYVSGYAGIGWTDNNDWVAAQLDYQIGSGTTKYIKIGGYGEGCSSANVACTSGNDRVCGYVGWGSGTYNILSGLTPGDYTLKLTPRGQMRYNCGSWNQVDHATVSATFTVPGWTTTSGTKAMGSVGVGSNTSATVSLGTHYGATSTVTSSVSGTNASDFTVTAVSATSVTVKFAPSAAGSRTATVTITDAYSKTYTLTVSGTGTTSCSTPTANDITISAPASTTTLYLGTGSAPSISQTVTATCSKGNTYLWSATPTSMSYTGAWGAGTATRAAFTSSGSKSTTATFYHEGVYTATFAAGCGNTTDASKNAPTITVKPGHIYFDGPFFSGSGYDLTKQHVAINTSTSQFVYEWTAAYTTGDFVISVGNACNNLASSAYTIGNYADVTKTGVTMGSSGNHNFSPNIGTINVGDRLKLTVTYTGVNSSGVPKYTVKLEKVCSNPTAQAVSGTAAICSGSSTNVTVASSQSGYTYKLYKGGSATATTKTGTGSALNFPVSEAGTYTVHAYYTSGSDAYCKADMTGSAIVTVTPTASIGSVTLTSSSVCIGEGLSAKANSVVLGGGTGAWSSSNTSIATVASTGVITPKAAGSTNITYTITGGCGGTVSKYATLTVKPNAAAAQYTLTNNTQTYNGAPRAVTVTPASGAGTATIYYTGTGGTSYAKSTTAPINAGTYAITVNAGNGTNYCAASDLSVGTLTINKANQSTLTISNTATDLVYCDAANVKLTTSGGSGDGAVTYTVTSGSGSVNGDVLSSSAKGSVSVTATKAASQNFNATTSEPKTFNFNKTAPTVYTLSNVGDATTICGDPSSGAGSGTLRLSNSQTGYSYQLYSNGSPVEGSTAKAGTTGSSIDFPVTSSGTYTVYGYYGSNSSNCPTQMDGEITLTISTQPRLVRSAAIVSQYTPVTITCISTDIETWEVTNAGSTAYLYDQTYNSVDFKGASTNSPYTITATTKGGCSETTTITVNTDHEDCN